MLAQSGTCGGSPVLDEAPLGSTESVEVVGTVVAESALLVLSESTGLVVLELSLAEVVVPRVPDDSPTPSSIVPPSSVVVAVVVTVVAEPDEPPSLPPVGSTHMPASSLGACAP